MTKPRQFTLEFVFVEIFLLGLTLGIARYAVVADSLSDPNRAMVLLVAAIPAGAFIGRIFGVDGMWKTAMIVFLFDVAICLCAALLAAGITPGL